MSTNDEHLKALIDFLKNLKAQGKWEPRVLEELERNIRTLDHEIKVGGPKKVKKVVGRIARLILKGGAE